MTARLALGMVGLAFVLLVVQRQLLTGHVIPPCPAGYTATTWPSGAVTCLAHEGPRQSEKD